VLILALSFSFDSEERNQTHRHDLSKSVCCLLLTITALPFAVLVRSPRQHVPKMAWCFSACWEKWILLLHSPDMVSNTLFTENCPNLCAMLLALFTFPNTAQWLFNLILPLSSLHILRIARSSLAHKNPCLSALFSSLNLTRWLWLSMAFFKGSKRAAIWSATFPNLYVASSYLALIPFLNAAWRLLHQKNQTLVITGYGKIFVIRYLWQFDELDREIGG